MRGGTVQVNWHDTQPVLTLDFHPRNGVLATGGADHDIKLWLLKLDESEKQLPTVLYQNSLSYHSTAVNVLRFSPSGDYIASGADGGELVIWKLHLTDDIQSWKVHKTLLFHRKDVLDLEWSPDGESLISGSVDNSCIIWDVNKGSVSQMLDAHLHYVQGVAWDPLGHYVASLSSDRTCRIYANSNRTQSKHKGSEKLNYVCQHVLTKSDPQNIDDSKSISAKSHLFHDETLPSFFRRLSWSPDGTFLMVPAGTYKYSCSFGTINTAYVLSRRDLSRPAMQLSGASKPIVVARFCPVLFALRGSNSAGFFKLPYRVIFGLATLDSLYIYDTESMSPIAIFAGLHYAAITDIAWSSDAKYVSLSSRDGYCTIIEFEKGELGEPLAASEKAQGKKADASLLIEAEVDDKKIKAIPVINNLESVAKSDEDEDRRLQPTTAARNADPKKSAKKRITPIPIN